jgi:ribosomal protein L29
VISKKAVKKELEAMLHGNLFSTQGRFELPIHCLNTNTIRYRIITRNIARILE